MAAGRCSAAVAASSAASVFYKYFDKPIERVVIAAANPIATFQNSDHARNFGIELEAGRQLGQYFFVNANYTFVDSKISLLPEQRNVQTSLERPLAGQSKNLFNLTAEFAVRGFSTRVLFNYFGDRISDVGANEAPDIIEEGRGSLDLVFAQRIRGLGDQADAGEPDRHRLPVHADAQRARDAAALQARPHRRAVVRLQRVLRPHHDDHKEQTKHHALQAHRVGTRRCRGLSSFPSSPCGQTRRRRSTCPASTSRSSW